MVRNLDLIREILLDIENWNIYTDNINNLFEKWKNSSNIISIKSDADNEQFNNINNEVCHQIDLIQTADFLWMIFTIISTAYGLQYTTKVGFRGLSNSGHDYINSIKTDTIWNKIKVAVKDSTFAIILETATAYCNNMMNEKLCLN